MKSKVVARYSEIICYVEIESAMKEVKKRHLDVFVDVSSKEGMVCALKGRMELREIRGAIEKIRVAEKKHYLDAGRKIDECAKKLTDILFPMELNYDHAIKEYERKKEAEKNAKLKEEQERIAVKIREEERAKREEEEKIQAEKNRIMTEEKKKHAKEKALFEKERAEFETARSILEAEKRAIAEKEFEEETKRRIKINQDERESRERIELAERESRRKIEEQQKEAKLIQDKIDQDKRKIELAKKEEQERIAAEEKKIADVLLKKEIDRLRKEAEKASMALLKKQKKMDGFSMLELFIGKYSIDKEFEEIAETISVWLENNKDK